jgi:hypothetical protein
MSKLIEWAPVVRDAEGWYRHPDMPEFDEDHEAEYLAWLTAQGLDTAYATLEAEHDTHPAHIVYFDQAGTDVSDWHPEEPAGDGWFTLSIHDSEDGPYWVWARRPATVA